MDRPSVNKSVLKTLKLFRSDVHLVWNHIVNRYQFVHFDKKQGAKRIIRTAENDDGSYRHPNEMDIVYLQTHVCWDMLDMYPDHEVMWAKFMEKRKESRNKKLEAWRDYRRWFNKDHKTEWRKAVENMKSGIYSVPEVRERKIISLPSSSTQM